ncbi:MAG TPA: hypothetical protein VF053_03950 [Streptosporangiales bacterium]
MGNKDVDPIGTAGRKQKAAAEQKARRLDAEAYSHAKNGRTDKVGRTVAKARIIREGRSN